MLCLGTEAAEDGVDVGVVEVGRGGEGVHGDFGDLEFGGLGGGGPLGQGGAAHHDHFAPARGE